MPRNKRSIGLHGTAAGTNPRQRDPLPGQPLLIPLPCDGCGTETRVFEQVYPDGTRLCSWCVSAVKAARLEMEQRRRMEANPDPFTYNGGVVHDGEELPF